VKYLIILDHSWDGFKGKKEVYKECKRTQNDYKIICIIAPYTKKLSEVQDFLNRIFSEKINKRKNEVVLLYHRLRDDIWPCRADRKAKFFNWIKNNIALFQEFFGARDHWVYVDVKDKLGKWNALNADNLPSWVGIRKKCEPNWAEIIISSLTPLHLSLQAFWGISRSENGTWVYFGKEKEYNDVNKFGIRKTDDINSEFTNKFPNRDAFLLVPEAEWDFYAPLLDMVLSPTDKKKGAGIDKKFNDNTPQEEKDMYGELGDDKHTIAEMLGKLPQKDALGNLIEAFNKPLSKEWEKVKIKPTPKRGDNAWLNIQLKNNQLISTSFELFVSCLREFTAILANTIEKDKDCYKKDVYFGYKGKYGKNEKGNNNYRDKILKGLNKDFSKPHCKLEEKKDDQNFGYERTLKKQIADWGIERAMVVIAGIEKLAMLIFNK